MLLRPLDPGDPEDVGLAFEVGRACDVAVIGTTEETVESTRARLSAPEVAAAFLGEQDGVAVAHLCVEVDPHGRDVFIDAYATGADAERWYPLMLDRGLALAAEHAAADPAPPVDADPFVVSADLWQASAAHYAGDAPYAHALRERGFRPVRRFWRMHRPVDAHETGEPQAPPGVARRTVRGEEDERLLHRMFGESFAEHFGFAERPSDEWLESLRAGAGVDPDRWWLAVADGEPVGLCIIDDSRAEFGDSYVRTIGVLPSARGRGIARWLLGCAVADAAARGRTGIGLSVDGENTTGATALYESVGFRARHVIDVLVRPL